MAVGREGSAADTGGAPRLVIGIGASAGGLLSLQALLRALPQDHEFSIVIVQHLEETHDELLIELLRESISVQIEQCAENASLRPGMSWLCPARSVVRLRRGRLHTEQARSALQRHSPIDLFLRSLAEEQGSRAVGIILSGAGSDGTLGLKAISDAGGMTIAQDTASAQYEEMPRNAATAGVVDHVLAPEDMPGVLIPYASSLDELAEAEGSREQVGEVLPAITRILQERSGHDFRHYKQSTLLRRVQRRMQVLRSASADSYVARLQHEPEEVEHLFREILIGVTAFFRDAGAFQTLSSTAIPDILAARSPDEPVRVWVVGCATGEEVYSLAILFREHLERLDPPLPEVRIFGTDIDERALERARQGAYPLSIAESISTRRLKRFFSRRARQYHVAKEIRDLCLFSPHNIISDPPFSRIDLLCCRNLLIYLGPHLQKKLIPLFHYALRPGGYLLLGPSESINGHRELFRTIDSKHRISRRCSRKVEVKTRSAPSTADGSRAACCLIAGRAGIMTGWW